MSMLTPAQMQALNQRAVIGDPLGVRPIVPMPGKPLNVITQTPVLPPNEMEEVRRRLALNPQDPIANYYANNAQLQGGGGTLPPLPPELQRISRFDDLRSRDMVNAFYANPEAYYAQRGGGAGVPGGIPQRIIGTAPKIVDGKLPNQGGAPANRSAGVVRDNFGGNPFAASVVKSEQRLDPITQQLLFGLDGQGGFIPGPSGQQSALFSTIKAVRLLFRRKSQGCHPIRSGPCGWREATSVFSSLSLTERRSLGSKGLLRSREAWRRPETLP